MMIRFLGFGSSHRRGATGWSDPVPPRALLNTCKPDLTGDGASPSGGADDVFHDAAEEYFLRRHLDPLLARRFPMEPALDGQGGGAFLRRNGRMLATFKPHVAAGFVTGKVGEHVTNGSANMADRARAAGVPVVLIRDNGVEPCRDLEEALTMLQALFYGCGREAALRAPGIALKALAEGGGDREQVLLALSCARETSRFEAWLEAVEGAVRVESKR